MRRHYGMLAGGVGIFLNLCLFAGKILCGMLTESISIIADAFNNLSDAGSSIITIAGFALAGQKADSEHPFGHGRIEYLTGLLVSLLIILMGFELAEDSAKRIMARHSAVYTPVSAAILAAAILVKLYMYCYNHRFAKLISSVALMSTACDSRNDCITTGAVLLCQLAGMATGIQIDAVCGLTVSIFIVISGLRSAVDTINPILGEEPSPELVDTIRKTVLSYSGILGVHDLVIHDYGPERRMMSLHAELPSSMTLTDAHDLADRIEKRMQSEFGIETVIHVDPVDQADPIAAELSKKLRSILDGIAPDLLYHDFRVVRDRSHLKVLFDINIPYDAGLSDEAVVSEIRSKILAAEPAARCLISVDHYIRKPGRAG